MSLVVLIAVARFADICRDEQMYWGEMLGVQNSLIGGIALGRGKWARRIIKE